MTQYTAAEDAHEMVRVGTFMDTDASAVFVFGSNLAGVHGGGAAYAATTHYGAEMGVGIGRTGRAYALPTKDEHIQTLPLKIVQGHIAQFLQYARENPNWKFVVTRVGCGLAGFTDAQIAPWFRYAPSNCYLPPFWESLYSADDFSGHTQ